MARINDNYLKLPASYLFPEISRRVKLFTDDHPDARVIGLGIGDVTRPLPAAIIEAMHRAVDEQGDASTFRGYGPEQGYEFLRQLIAGNDYAPRNVRMSADEIFVSDGSKCDSGNIQEIFADDSRIAVADPVYPVYVDATVMSGRSGPADGQGRYGGILYMPCRKENGFLPEVPDEAVDLVYLCSPNNPTGSVLSKEALAGWVEYARTHDAVLLFDAAYAAYITDPGLPQSIYEIDGAREVAIEFRSFSKTAGFTGIRCAYTVVPEELTGKDASGERVSLKQLWSRRQTTKFNGASYPVQAGAAAAYSPQGKAQVRELVAYYLENAAIIREGLAKAGWQVFGGVHAPYIWLETPDGLSSWDFFDRLLERAHVVGTPGSGFGPSGEGYFRLSAFGERADVEEAVARICERLG